MHFRSVSSLLLSSLTTVNEGLSLTIVNETTNFLKMNVFENDLFLKRFPLKRFVFRFFVVVFTIYKKNENDLSLPVVCCLLVFSIYNGCVRATNYVIPRETMQNFG